MTAARTRPGPGHVLGLVAAHKQQTQHFQCFHNNSQHFYGHSYTAPTPREWVLQKLGLVISRALALHLRDVTLGFLVEPTHPNDEDFEDIEVDPDFW